MITESMSTWNSWLCIQLMHTNITLSKYVYRKIQWASNLKRTEMVRLWSSKLAPCSVSSLSIKRCGKNWNPLITQILPLSHTFYSISIHHLFRFLRIQSSNSCGIKLMYSTIYPTSFYFLFRICTLFSPIHSQWIRKNFTYLLGFSIRFLSQ